jgi:calcineurin-like phosphoesterase family protein
MRTWLITDTHLGHSNLVARGIRPANYEEKIWRGLDNCVKGDDLLVHLGDVAFGPYDDQINRRFTERKCLKWLLIGNHDSRSMEWYLKRGWGVAAEVILLKQFGELIALSHRPLPYVEGKAWYTLNIHGHCHTGVPDYAALGDENGSHHRLIALELDGYQPLGLQWLVMKKRKGR